MSELTINEKGFSYLRDITLNYVKVRDAVTNFNKDGKEWTIDICLDKKTAKQFKKAFKKNSFKEFDNEDYLSTFKVDEVPYPKQEEQYVVKIKQATVTKSGELIETGDRSRPRILVPTDSGPKDVTANKLVSNGSKGHVAFTVWTNNDGLSFTYLRDILVTDLIEYVEAPKDAFGEVVEDSDDSAPFDEDDCKTDDDSDASPNEF